MAESDSSASQQQPAHAGLGGFQRDDRREELYDKPLPAARRDVQISPQLYMGRTAYMVKDPVSLTYFRLNPAEHHVLRHLDGKNTARQLAETVCEKFPEQPIDPDHVLEFIKMLQGTGLLLGKGEAHAEWLRRVRDTRRRKKLRAQLMNFLFIKLPLFDPDRALDVIYSYTRFVMNRWWMWLAIAFMAVSTAAAIGEIFRTGLNLMFPLLAWQNLLILTAVFLSVKVIHEFGHGLAAKVRGLEVHEMGVLIMVFLPMLYVDVTDAWMVPRRKDRLWITSGGVFIEFLFASLCVWVWLATEAGPVNQVAFNVMLAASVTTLLFNANPLLRYDGYYFLMDWVQIPNLKTKSTQYMAYLGKRYVLAMKGQHAPREASQRPVLIPTFAVASSLYRWVIVFAIIGMVYAVLDPYGLEVIAAFLAMAALTTMVFLPLMKMLRFVWSQQAQTWRRMAATVVGVGAAVAVVWGVLAIPSEDSVKRPLVVLAEDRQPVFVPYRGRVAEVYVESGQVVEAGDPLVRLEDQELRDELRTLQVERQMMVLRRDAARQFERLQHFAVAAPRIEQIDRQIDYLERRIERMTVRAPISGRVAPQLRLAAALGTHLNANDELAVIVGTGPRELVMIVPQQEASLLQAGMDARVRLWGAPAEIYHGRLETIGSRFVERLPHEALSSVYSGEVDTSRGGEYKSPSAPSVEARIVLDQPLPSTADGLTGRGRVVLGRSTLGEQQWRNVRNLLSLDWWL